MSRKNQKIGQQSFWTNALPEGVHAPCPLCSEDKPLSEFWSTEAHKYLRNCTTCSKAKPSYSEYIKSPAWRKKRREYWQSGLMRECYVCADPWVGFKGKHLHHMTYERLGNEALSDLVPLCPHCHDIVTDAWAAEKLLPRSERRTLREVTEVISSESAEERFMKELVLDWFADK